MKHLRSWTTTRWFAPAVFLAISLALYGNTLPGEFVYDDAFFVNNGALRQAAYLRDTWFEASLKNIAIFAHYRPVTFASFALNFLVTGESPFWFHAVSILLNGLACWLLFCIVRKLTDNTPLAWCTAVLFALLPIHTESVAYIKARDELLVAFFGFSAWIAFLRATSKNGCRGWLWGLAAAALALMAFFSKESAVVFPGVLGGVLLAQHGWRGVWNARLPLLLQIGALVLYFSIHNLVIGRNTVPNGEILYFGQNPLGYLGAEYVPWTAVQLLFVAVAQTFVPWNLSATYGFAHIPIVTSPFGSWMVPAGVATALFLLAAMLLPRVRKSPMGMGATVFLVLYFPFSKIPFYQSIDFFAERWLYAPSAGLAMMGGYVLWIIWHKYRAVAPIVFTAIIVAYLFVLLPRNLIWRNETTLGESMVRDAPNSVTGYVFLANNRLQYGRLPEATELVTKGLSISREHIPIHHVAAAVALSAGQLHVAEQAVMAAEQLGGDELANVILRATLLAKQHRYQESLNHLRQSKWFDTNEHRTRMLMALNLWMLDRHDEAKQYFDWDAYLPVVKMTDEEKIFMFETY